MAHVGPKTRRKGLDAPRRPASLVMVLALGLAGVLVSALLARLHAQVQAGGASFCAFTDVLSCDRVAVSRFSVQLGLPVAVWGVLGFSLIALLASSGLARHRSGTTWPAGLLFLASAGAAAVSIMLAVLSKVAIGAWCPLCVVAWAISLGLLATSWRLCRAVGVKRAVRNDLAALQARPLRAVGGALLAMAALALTFAAYPRYWEHPAAHVHTASAPVTALPAPGTRGAPPLVVFEYTDYQCPSCARMHAVTRSLPRRTDVTLVRRHFPLDPSCNPAVTRQMHPVACDLARAGICAEEQGRLAEIDDVIFANQHDPGPIEALAAKAGLDPDRFRACLSSPETEKRLAADIAAGIRDRVQATPSYVVRGKMYAGSLPPELFQLTLGN